jgi:plastocyanin
VPAEVQKAAETEASGGQIVRWEKEGKHYEAVVNKDGKEWGFKFNAKGKFLGKHEESAEHKDTEPKS